MFLLIEIHLPLHSASEYPIAHSQVKFVVTVAIHVALLLHGLLSQTCATKKTQSHINDFILLFSIIYGKEKVLIFGKKEKNS